MIHRTNRRTVGFTLMEMLVVVSIIVILASLTFGGFNFVKKKQAREKAKVQIALLQLALEDYKSDNGAYPVNGNVQGTGGTDEIFDALFPADADAKIYLSQLNPESDGQGWLDGETGQSLTIFDPWGYEYRYRTNNPANPDQTISANPGFDMWSVGPDGKTNVSAGNYDPKHPDNQDDIQGW